VVTEDLAKIEIKLKYSSIDDSEEKKIQIGLLKSCIFKKLDPLLRSISNHYQLKGGKFNFAVLNKVVGRKADHILGSIVDKNWSYWKRLMHGKGKDRF